MMYRDDNRGRHRSRTPPMERPRGGMRDDYDGGSRGGGGEAGPENPVNLLLNLSQMLSQKMEQKRIQMEREKRGSYDDRSGYRGGPR